MSPFWLARNGRRQEDVRLTGGLTFASRSGHRGTKHAQMEKEKPRRPLDFLDFRDDLIPASGIQSVQFRLIENKLGMRRGDRLQLHAAPYTSRLTEEDAARVEAAEKEPSLFDLIEGWLERTPFLNFGDFDFWREYRQAVDSMLASDRASVRSNPTLTEDEKATQLARVEATSRPVADLVDARFSRTAGLFRASSCRVRSFPGFLAT